MRDIALVTIMLVLPVATSHAEPGFDPRYERDYNIFTPTTQYRADNPLNPVNKHDPDSVFNPVNRYDPGNPLNPTNRYSPNNPFNPVNQYHPENPLNPANQYNSDVPFGPLDGGGRDEKMMSGYGRTVKPRRLKSSSKVKQGT